MIRNLAKCLCLAMTALAASWAYADAVSTARLGSLHPKNGVVVTDVNLSTYSEKSFVAPDFDATRDYSYGDVVAISNRFYVFNQNWHHQWSGSPIEYQCVDELTSLQQLGKYLFAKDYLTLGYGGTNAPSYKKIYVGHENNNACYFILETSGFQFEDEYGGEFRMIGDEFRYTSDGHMWSKRLRNMLTIDSILPFTSTYLAEAYKQNPTSPYYVHAYLTNNYLTAGQTSDQYLKKTDAASTYMTEMAADGKYSTPAGVASAIASALNSQRVTCLYNSSGNYRLNYNGQIQRQTHNGYNVSWTNESSGLVLMYANPNKWRCEHPQLGELWFTRSDGVISCDSMAIIRGEEDYPGTTVITISPLGTFRAFVNAYGTLSWNDYDRFAKESEVGDYAVVSNKAMNAISAVTNTVTESGVQTDYVAQQQGQSVVGGPRIRWSRDSEQNMTSYAYNGVAVRRNGNNEDYWFDDTKPNGVARMKNVVSSQGVTNIVRALSLGGIWDVELQVWWTPRMRNGSLTYEATTNVNLNAGN